MKKILLSILVLLLPLFLLSSIILKYEYVLATGKVVYLEASGFDPTDLFRGDYVDLRYIVDGKIIKEEIKKYGDYKYKGFLYFEPEIVGDQIKSIKKIYEQKPENILTLKVKNDGNFFVNENTDIKIELEKDKKILSYLGGCYDGFEKGDNIFAGLSDNRDLVWLIYKEDSLINKEDRERYEKAKILEIGKCKNRISLNILNANKCFVKQKTGRDLEEKIRKGGIMAEIVIGNDGSVILKRLFDKETKKTEC